MSFEDWLTLITIGVLIIFLSVLIIIVNESTDDEQVCSNQCGIKNLSFSSYTGGGYKNYVCNCLNESTKEIRTIYTK